MRRSVRLGLVGALAVGIFGNLVAIGCSATGGDSIGVDAIDSGGDTGPSTVVTPTKDASGVTDAISPTAADAGQDAGKDAGKDAQVSDAGVDAAKDAGPTYLAPGDFCQVVNKIYTRPCGKCGTQEALCQAAADAGSLPDGGVGGILSAYGVCGNQVGACTPGDTQACGSCGTQSCSNSCNWTTCTGQGQCAAGSVEYSTATCTDPNSFIQRTCGNTCSWGAYSATCTTPSLTVPATVDAVNSGAYQLGATLKMKRVDTYSDCPASSLYYTSVPYFAVPVTNNTGKAAVVQVYNSGSNPLDTVLVVYDGASLPPDDTALKACAKLEDNCAALSDLCGNATSGGSSYDWAGIDGVAIPAGGTVMVITYGYSSSETGPFTLNVKTKTLN